MVVVVFLGYNQFWPGEFMFCVVFMSRSIRRLTGSLLRKPILVTHIRTVFRTYSRKVLIKWAVTRDFQQCGILTRVDSDKPVQPFFKLRNSKWCSVSSLTLIEYSSDKQRLWSDCAYAQADLRLCWLHIPHCWKSHAPAQFLYLRVQGGEKGA